MATSKSPEKWIAGALLYSGRRDPTWEVPESLIKRLEKLWDAMPPGSTDEVKSSQLGYRGVFLRAPDGREWRAFDGVASLTRPDVHELRADPGRQFEKSLLASAPKGLLPDVLEP